MNVTVDDVEPPYTTNTNTGKPEGGDAYIFVVGFFGIGVLLITLTYTSYMCKRSLSPPPPTLTFGTATATASTSDDADNHHLITFSRGLDDDVLVTFPMFLYSEATVSHKAGDSGSDCSICLADYKPADVVLLLPECGHLFHVNCIDTWLKAHPTCPMCRNLPLAGTLPLAVQAS